jgi:hypothetical protein
MRKLIPLFKLIPIKTIYKGKKSSYVREFVAISREKVTIVGEKVVITVKKQL